MDAQALPEVHVGLDVGVDGFAHIRRELGHVDAGQGVNPQVDVVLVTLRTHFANAIVVPGGQHIGTVIGVEIEEVEVVRGRPGDAILDVRATRAGTHAVLQVVAHSFAPVRFGVSAHPAPDRRARLTTSAALRRAARRISKTRTST